MKDQEVEGVRKDGPVVIRAGRSSPVNIELGTGPVKFERSFHRPRRIAVTPAGNDDIGQVLHRLDIGFETINDAQLCDRALLGRFSTLFLNCSSEAVEQASGAGEALAAFVAAGGSLYASDWAGAYIEAAFPSVFGGEHSGTSGTVTASVVQRDVRRLLGSGQVPLHFDMPSWYAVSRFSLPGGTGEVYLAEGRRPLMVAFRHGRGQVVFTSFHNRAQPGDMSDKLLKFLVLVPVVRSAGVATHVIQLTGGNLRRYVELESGRS